MFRHTYILACNWYLPNCRYTCDAWLHMLHDDNANPLHTLIELRREPNYAQAEAVQSFVGILHLKSALNARLCDSIDQRESVHSHTSEITPFQIHDTVPQAAKVVHALATAIQEYAALCDLWMPHAKKIKTNHVVPGYTTESVTTFAMGSCMG